MQPYDPYVFGTPGINPGAPDPRSIYGGGGQQQDGGLPAIFQNNPQAYGQLLRTQYFNPLETGEKLYGWRPEALGSSNGLIVIRKPDKQKAALAAALAAYANSRQMEALQAAMEGRQPQPSWLGKTLQGVGGSLYREGINQWNPGQSDWSWGGALRGLGNILGRAGGNL